MKICAIQFTAEKKSAFLYDGGIIPLVNHIFDGIDEGMLP